MEPQNCLSKKFGISLHNNDFITLIYGQTFDLPYPLYGGFYNKINLLAAYMLLVVGFGILFSVLASLVLYAKMVLCLMNYCQNYGQWKMHLLNLSPRQLMAQMMAPKY
jgi:hypothetical protein